MTQLNFDATQVAPDTGTPDPIPAGWYNVMLDESEMNPTKDGTGNYLKCRFTVMDGEYANRKVYTNLNLRNANPVAQEIAYKQLSAIAHAVNVLNVQDSSQLHGIPLKIKVKIRPEGGGYDAQNEISAFRNINDPTGATAGGSAPAGGSGVPAGFGAPVQQPAQPAQQQPAAQPWAQPAPQGQPPAQGQPAPQQQPAQPQQPPQGQPAWQQPAQQPWAQPPAQGQQPVQQPAQQQPAAQGGPQFTPQNTAPPWQQPAQ